MFARYRITLFAFVWMIMIVVAVPISGYAQGLNNGVVMQYVVQGEDIQTGNIVSRQNDLFSVSQTANDPHMFGVIVSNPAITLGKKDEQNTVPVTTTGVAPILVSSQNGLIQKGDYITSSKQPGIGTKLVEAGYAIGVALENANSFDDSTPQLISATILPQQVTAKMIEGSDKKNDDMTNETAQLTENQKLKTFIEYVKIITSGLVVLTACIGGVLYYIQLSKIEVEALGRNPKASQTIQGAMYKHGFVALLMCVSGLVIGYIILKM